MPRAKSHATGRPSLASALAVIAICAVVSSPVFAADRPLRVATGAMAPFVLPHTDPPAGFSIDLWREVASRMGVEYTWKVISAPPEHLPADLLQAVERGDADVAIAAIVMTGEREKVVDFSFPYFDSGLQIMVRVGNERPLLAALRSVPWSSIAQLFGVAILIVWLLANVIWLIERRRNADFQKPYWRAIGEGLWGTMLIIATGEHGGQNQGAIKRLAVVLMWLVGVVLIAQLTATVTSSQTVDRLQSSIQGPKDLPGKSIGSVPGSAAAEYLSEFGLPFAAVRSADEGFRMLMQREVQCIVFDAPTLQYWAAKRGGGMLKVVGPLFRPEKYGIVVAEGSPLRKPINKALLSIYEDGTYETIYARWFSRGEK